MDSHLKSSEEVVAAYAALRTRTLDLIRTCDQGKGELRVPHCPAWTVRELVAHMVGVPEDILAGRLEGVTTEAWTQAQVDRHHGDSLVDLADKWASNATTFDPVLAMIPEPVNSQVVFDVTTHEHDLRHALGTPGSRDSDAIAVSVGWILNAADKQDNRSAAKLRALGLDDFTLMRVFTGRRSRRQIEALGLDADDIAHWLESTPLALSVNDVDE